MISIITPTYNRGILLKEVYASLVSQTNSNFEWIIVDDGSIDNTKQVVNEFLNNDNFFQIKYIQKENGGKHTAINHALKYVNYNYSLFLDSDDLLTEEAIDSIINDINYYDLDKQSNIAGLIYQIGINKNTPIKKSYYKENQPIISDYITANFKLKMKGDRAEIYKTDVLKINPFPFFEGENFLSEELLWTRIANQGFSLVYIPKIIYIGRYQTDGLTSNSLKCFIKNWRGTQLYYNELMNYNLPLQSKLRIYSAYIRRKNHKEFNLTSLLKTDLSNVNYICHLIGILIGSCLYTYDKMKSFTEGRVKN